MKRVWALQDAKNKLSEVVDHSIAEGPQTITRRGRESAVVLSMKDFKRLTGPEGSLVSFFRDSPLAEWISTWSVTRTSGAATALEGGLTAVTENVRHFEATECRVHNHWER